MRQMTLPLVIAAAMATAVAAAQTMPDNGSRPEQSQAPQTMSSATQAAPANNAKDTKSRPQAQANRSKRPESAQTQPSDASRQSRQAAATETRPDATYPHPSGQDSQPDNSSHKTRIASADSKEGIGTANNRGPKASDQTRQVRKLSKRKTYTGSSGSKADPSTACSTSRPTQDGGVDCGTSGNSATEGNVVTKPH